jgi:hypothetical protein
VEQQNAGHNSEARDLFAACRLPQCLPAVRKECTKQYMSLAAGTGTRGESGGAATEVAETSASSLGPTCSGAWKAAVEKQKAGHLSEARELFGSCRQASCLPAVRKECAKQFDQLEGDIPSVVAVVTDASGEPRTDVEVKVDGHLLATNLDGRSVAVDPGVHEFSFSSKDGDVFGTQKIMVAEGQRNRLISAAVPGAEGDVTEKPKKPAMAAAKRPAATKVSLAATHAPDTSTSAGEGDDSNDSGADATVTKPGSNFHTPALTYVFAATGLVGLGGAGLLTYWGRKDATSLSVCSPHCPQSSADHIHQLYLGADVALGVGVAALVGSYWAYAHAKSKANSEEMGKETETAYVFGVQPVQSGAVGTIGGTF